MENTDTTNLPGASSSEETPPVKSQRKPPLSFRPKSAETQEFIDKLLQEFGSPQKVIEHCVNIAMSGKSQESFPTLSNSINEELKKENEFLHQELKLMSEKFTTNPHQQQQQFSPDQESFIEKFMAKKKTNREEAIKFCIIYTKDNILWF